MLIGADQSAPVSDGRMLQSNKKTDDSRASEMFPCALFECLLASLIDIERQRYHGESM
jgi:hypothetical protein